MIDSGDVFYLPPLGATDLLPVAMNQEHLPIDGVLPLLRQTLTANHAVVLQAPPGAGKTTHVPLALLDEAWLAGRSILMLEPRRLAARAACARMAQLRGETAGETVGYRIRFDAKVSAKTRIEVLTEGILTRRLQTDPELKNVGLVIFDEFHERHLHADLALALCLDSQKALREARNRRGGRQRRRAGAGQRGRPDGAARVAAR